ncbi:hypothetical protein COO60DRAFT_1704025 [Scenedesmus sp. NREL 46B-D3]|nr:hypothetical protein COO60DRAFT_1704025 [Scenedesmus sp. NREL 46B-D3]
MRQGSSSNSSSAVSSGAFAWPGCAITCCISACDVCPRYMIVKMIACSVISQDGSCSMAAGVAAEQGLIAHGCACWMAAGNWAQLRAAFQNLGHCRQLALLPDNTELLSVDFCE